MLGRKFIIIKHQRIKLVVYAKGKENLSSGVTGRGILWLGGTSLLRE